MTQSGPVGAARGESLSMGFQASSRGIFASWTSSRPLACTRRIASFTICGMCFSLVGKPYERQQRNAITSL
jgi:hypothetical protein